MEIISALGIILIVGYLSGLVAERIGFPRVTAYLLSGVLFSPELLGHLADLKLELWSESFISICLGIIAFVVGGKITINESLKNRKLIFTIVLFESLFAVFFVFISFFFIGFFIELPKEIAIIMASVAATTAPAATIAIIQEYRAKGKMTDLILNIVALDDAVGVIIFSIIGSLFFFSESSGVHTVFHELGMAIVVGLFAGWLLKKLADFSTSNDYLFPLLIGVIFVIESMSVKYGFSTLLSCITLGLVSNNLKNGSGERVSILLPIEHIEEFVFITFFTLAGTHFSMSHFTGYLPLIVLYVLFRGLGKYLGAFLGLKISNMENSKIVTNLGFALLPQAGIAIGLIFQLTHANGLSNYRDMLINIVLGSTIIYELTGPFFARYALGQVKEIDYNR